MSHAVIEGFQLSAQQARSWGFHHAHPHLHAQALVAIDGPLDVVALWAAVRDVAGRHEIFRTTFRALPEMQLPIQVIDDDAPIDVPLIDAADATLEAAAVLRDRAAADEATRRWAFDRVPLVRCVLVRWASERHTLIVTLPPLCADYRTLTNLVQEIASTYGERTGVPRSGREPEVEPLQYVEFAEWQRELLQSQDAEEGRRFWQTQGIDQAESAAPAALLRDAGAAVFTPSVRVRDVDSSIVRRIGMLTTRRRTSQAAFWMACWNVVMWHFGGRPDLVMGRLFHGRRYPETQTGMGPFARCLPVRCRGGWTSSCAELLTQLHDTITEADARQEYYEPTEPADAPRDAQAWPLMFEFQEWPSTHRVGAVQFRTERQSCHAEPFTAKLTCVCSDHEWRTELHVDASRVAPATADWLLAHLHRMVDSALARPEGPVSDLDMLTDDQRQQLLISFNDTHVELPDAERPLAWHIEAQAARTPQATAIAGQTASGQSVDVTYDELNRWANRIARELRAAGVEPEARVAVMMRRSPGLLAAMLGTIKAGGAYVPIDPADPAGRIAAILADAGASIVLTDAGAASTAAERTLAVPELPPVDLGDEPNPAPCAGPDHLVYVIYTSGSTGTPKGALITHRGLMNYLLWAANAYGVTQAAGAPLHSSVAFDLSVTTLFVPLLVGAAVSVGPERAPGEDLAHALRLDRAFGFIKGTPAHLQALSWQMPLTVLDERTCALIVGGEALYAEAVRLWREAAPGVRIYNEYGPTETVVGSCVHEVGEDTPRTGAVPIGRPIGNTRVYVLDRQGRLAPPGVEGELFIGGAGVARGYLNRPDLTADRFVPDLFGPAGARLYRTGDTVRWQADGELVYVGRIDHQVKLRGYRVELGDVEAALRTIPDVQDAVALVREDGQREKRLVAYLVSDAPTRPSAEDLRKTLRLRVPDYMLPDAIVWMDALPLTRNGKVDRRALPAPENPADRSAPLTRPTNPVEEVMAAIWADVLGLEEVGIHDNFFVIGGDSIRAIQVRARARQRGLELTHEALFEHQTIAALGRVLSFGQTPAASAEPLAPFALISPEDRERLPQNAEDAYPIAALQAGMMFHSELAQDSAVFHDLHSFVLRAPLDADLMRASLTHVMQRHSVLRTAFEWSRYSRPLQIVYRDVPPPIEITDLRGQEGEAQQQAMTAWLHDERHWPFDGRRPPLLRFHIHRFSDEQFQFTMSFHHAALDGWSAASLLTELFNRYRDVQERPDAPAPAPLQSTFRDFVALEQAAEQAEDSQRFWREQLQAGPVTRLTRLDGWPHPWNPEEGIGLISVPVAAEVVEGLRRFSRAAALPLKSIALAAHLKVLAAETNQSVVVTGMVSNGRPEAVDGERVLGLFLNTVPAVCRVGAQTWRELAQDAFDCERRLLPFRRYPLARMQRDRGEGAIFDAAFNFMHYHVYQGVQQSNDMQVEGYAGYEETDVPLMANFFVDPASAQMRLSLSFRRPEFTQAQVTRFGERYVLALTAMAADPDVRHAAADLLTAAEREELAAMARPRTTEPWDAEAEASIGAWFEAQVARTPAAPALTFGQESLDYATLNARVNQLARHLQQLGVGADVPVAICVERSADLVIALLATFKAGGAYVPLDPTYPAERLALVLDDARPRVLLTQRDLLAALPPSATLPTTGAVTFCLDAEWPVVQRQDDSNLPQATLAGSLAYVMYTSGSTGRPKGVMIPHGTVLNFLLGMDRVLGVPDAGVWLAVTSASFDISVLELIWTLTRGLHVVLAPADGARQSGADAPAALMRTHGATHLQCTPSWARLLLADPAANEALGGLKQLLVGGEALPSTLAADLLPRLHGDFFNMYGPTETTIWSSADRVTDPAHITLGVPILNTQIHIADRHGHAMPLGSAGEVWIGGDGVSRGYLHRADLTADRFVPDPFGSIEGARVYRTGDRGRLAGDGRIEFLGRLDQQIKLRGHRIELGDVEAALRQRPGVRDAAALLREDAPGERRLVGYIVLRANDAATSGEPAASEAVTNEAVATEVGAPAATSDALQQALRASLPEHMVPSVIVLLDAFPLTPNGKVDRRQLPAPSGDRPTLAQVYVAPRNEVESTLARIWTEVLRVERVGVNDSFFALGGHSLTATQVVARIRDAFAIELALRPLFESPTVAQLAIVVEQQRALQPALGETSTAMQTEAVADIDQLLEELETMSADDVRSLLGGQP